METIRTLVVDDDFMVAQVHRGFTERVPGFHVVGVAHTGREALDAVQRLAPDLVVLDVYLPDMSGLEVLRVLRSRPQSPDVLVVTAARDAESLREAMRGGALHYLIKPFDAARFTRALESYRRFRLRRASTASLQQRDVDHLYALLAPPAGDDLPKGLHRSTLALVARILAQASQPLGAQQVAEAAGISRATARRYLEHLEQRGEATLQLEYGATGRPAHRYRAVTRSE